MAFGFANWWFLVLYLLFSMGGQGNGIRELTSQNDVHKGKITKIHMHEHLSSLMDNMGAWFTMNDLYVGKVMSIPIILLNKNISSTPHFLPREDADSIPFSYTQLPNLLQFFSISTASPQAKIMEHTLEVCESKPGKGETKICATSLESMLDFVCGVFGLETDFKALTTTTTTHLPKVLPSHSHYNFSISEVPKEVSTTMMVGCHTIAYPYAVFYCHTQDSEVKVFEISLVRGEDGSRVEAVAACHMDTSDWSADHIAFHVLGFSPGGLPVCHFFPIDHLVWVSSPALLPVY